MPEYSPEEILYFLEKAERLFRSGLSKDQVCSQLDVTESELKVWIERYSMPPEVMDALGRTNTGDSIVPIFEAPRQDEDVTQVGTGVAIAIGPERYVLTAAHVTDSWKEKELYIPSNSGIVSVSGTLFSRPLSPNESRDDDMVDVSYFRLSPKLAEDLHDTIRPFQIDEMDLSGSCGAGDSFTFCGFPWRKTKRVGLSHQTEMATYTGHVVTEKDYLKCGCDRNVHVAIRFRLKKSYSWKHQSHKVAPHPQGISGGAALAWPRLLKDRMSVQALKLAGVVHTYKKQSDVLVATKIAPFIYAIIEDSPHLAKYFEAASKDIGGFGEFISNKMKELNTKNVPSSTGISWYLPDTYQKCLSIFDDAEHLPGTYQDWLIRALVTEKQLISQGMNVVRVVIDPAVFKKWCKTNRLKKRDASARSRYCSTMQWEAYQRSLSNHDK